VTRFETRNEVKTFVFQLLETKICFAMHLILRFYVQVLLIHMEAPHIKISLGPPSLVLRRSARSNPKSEFKSFLIGLANNNLT